MTRTMTAGSRAQRRRSETPSPAKHPWPTCYYRQSIWPREKEKKRVGKREKSWKSNGKSRRTSRSTYTLRDLCGKHLQPESTCEKNNGSFVLTSTLSLSPYVSLPHSPYHRSYHPEFAYASPPTSWLAGHKDVRASSSTRRDAGEPPFSTSASYSG